MNSIQRWTPAGLKSRLDRRFARRDRVADLEAEVSVLGREVSTLVGRLDETHGMLTETIATVNATQEALAGRLDEIVSSAVENMASMQLILDALEERLTEVDDRSQIGAAFVRDENPHDLRKRLFHAHQLARQAGEAIESLLQAELTLWQAIDQLAAETRSEHSALAGSTDERESNE